MEEKSKEDSPLISSYETNRVNETMNRIGFGKYQYLLGMGICIISFTDGAEITLLTVVSYILESEWDLSTTELSFLGGSILFGMSIGYLLSPILETRFGRLQVIYASLVMLVLFGVASGLVGDIWTLSLMRALVGLSISMSVPACFALAAEMCPSDMRGRYMLVIELCFGLGQIFVVLLSLWLVPNLDSENWRILVIIIALIIIPSGILLYLYGFDSPLFLARNREYGRAVEVLNRIADMNKEPHLTEEEIDNVYFMIPSYVKNADSKWTILIDKWHRAITIKTILLCTICTVAYYGITVILPFILDFESAEAIEILYGLLLIYCCQVPCVVLLIYFVEKEYFGRKNTFIYVGALIAVIMEVTAAVNSSDLTFLMILITVSLANGVFCVILVFIPEVFETELRIVSLAVANIFGRLIGSFSIYLFFFLVDQSNSITFMAIGFFFAVFAFIGFTLPYDTTGMALDSKTN